MQKQLASARLCIQTVCVKTVTYPVRLTEGDYHLLLNEAKRRRKSLADLFRDLVVYGLPALPPIPDYEAAQEAWDALGPAPEINYGKLPKKW